MHRDGRNNLAHKVDPFQLLASPVGILVIVKNNTGTTKSGALDQCQCN